MLRRKFVKALAGVTLASSFAGSLAVAPSAMAQEFPNKPITIVVPYVAGTLADLIARVAAGEMSNSLKQPVIVDNRPGAFQIIAGNYVAQQPANGYTLMVTAMPNVIAPNLRSTTMFKGNTDFEGIAHMVDLFGPFVVSAKLGVNNLQEFIALLKANPGKYRFASAGLGTPMHMGLEAFLAEIGVQAEHVPYKSFVNGLTDLSEGMIDFSSAPFSYLKSPAGEKVKVIGAYGPAREPGFPDIKTVAEQGYPGFEAAIKYFLVAPKGTPAPIVAKLNEVANAAVSSEAFVSKVKALGGVTIPPPQTPAQIMRTIESEDKRYEDLVAKRNIKFD